MKVCGPHPAAVVAACLVICASSSAAQTKRPMTLVDLLEVPNVGDPQLSQDGTRLLFTMNKADWKAGRKITHIWRISADGTGQMQMTFGEKGESSPRWSPDGRRIAFLARRGDSEDSQIFLIDNDGGEARALSKHASAVSDISWTPDGHSIYFIASEAKTDEEKEREKAKDDVFAFDENYKQRHLWRILVADGTERQITDGDYSIIAYNLSPDGRKVVVNRAPSPLLDDGDQSELWILDPTGAGAVQLTRNDVGEREAQFSPDASQVLFVADGHPKLERYYTDSVFLVPATGGTPQLLAPDLPYEVERAAWARDGRSVFVVANLGVHSELFQIDLASGVPHQLTDGRHSIQGWTFVRDAGRHVFQFDEPTRFGEVWTLQVAAGAKPSQVTKVYDRIERDFKLPRQERIEWKAADGTMIEGLLFYPLDYEAGKRYPLCVQTHGGPQASDKFGFGGWSSYVQVLTARGYAVLKPNYRGSTGYGNQFLRDMVGSYFRNAHLDVMAGTDRVIQMGVADPDRMVKMGWSAGGHMTNKIITFTDRFKAASSSAGAANWVSMYAQSDTRADRTPWFGGTPWQKQAPIDVYWSNSPLKDASNAKTPTIFLVGQNDLRVPPPQSVEMYRALKSNGVPTHLYMAPREPHVWGELRHQLFKMNVELEWFEKYATGRPYTWERAPGDPSTKERSKTSPE